jgi:regulator of protease activity HflC (stomatin/prohibitin superfamily)
VLTLFGKYYGTLVGPGFFYVNPFTVANNPASGTQAHPTAEQLVAEAAGASKRPATTVKTTKKISLKSMTLSNDKQKINDKLGNPIIIGIVVIWRVANTARAAFNVDNYAEFLSIQCDSALRNIVRLYPYDISDEAELNEMSLRSSSAEISQHLREEIQEKVEVAGLEIVEARITHLAYAPEIAAAMLQRQQAKAIIDARQMIVEGAVGMVETALAKLSENEIVTLDEERKAAMVSNLLVVLCGNKDAQPVVNSGSLY